MAKKAEPLPPASLARAINGLPPMKRAIYDVLLPHEFMCREKIAEAANCRSSTVSSSCSDMYAKGLLERKPKGRGFMYKRASTLVPHNDLRKTKRGQKDPATSVEHHLAEAERHLNLALMEVKRLTSLYRTIQNLETL